MAHSLYFGQVRKTFFNIYPIMPRFYHYDIALRTFGFADVTSISNWSI